MSEEKTIEQLFAELTEAQKHLEAQIEQQKKDIEEANHIEGKAEARVNDARNVFNGCARRAEEAMQKIRAAAPHGTIWNQGPERPERNIT